MIFSLNWDLLKLNVEAHCTMEVKMTSDECDEWPFWNVFAILRQSEEIEAGKFRYLEKHFIMGATASIIPRNPSASKTDEPSVRWIKRRVYKHFCSDRTS